MKVPTLIIKNMFGAEETFDIFTNIKKGVYFIDNVNDVLKYLEKEDIIPLDKDINKLWQMDSKNRILDAINEIMRR